jgi:hypothetical protein
VQVRRRHADLLTLPIRPLEDASGHAVSVYRMPLPDCVCHDGKALLASSSSHAKSKAGKADWLTRSIAAGAHAIATPTQQVPRIWKGGWVPGSLAHGKP